MAPQKSPAFQFYPKDFMAGTATMSNQEVGAYMRLLCYAWDAGSVPNDSRERSRIVCCSLKQERILWHRLERKFALVDGVYVNERMEEERQKQAEYRRRQSDKGKASAIVRWQPEGNQAITVVNPRLQPDGNSSSSSSSSSSLKDKSSSRPAALVMSPLAYERRKQQCAFVGSRLEVPHLLHGELRKMLGGLNAEADLLAWYHDLDAEIEASGEAIVPDVFRWLKARFSTWAEAASEPTIAERAARIEAMVAARKAVVS
jgi:uncharacterized protein YdaU (DUF1376 family)